MGNDLGGTKGGEKILKVLDGNFCLGRRDSARKSNENLPHFPGSFGQLESARKNAFLTRINAAVEVSCQPIRGEFVVESRRR